MRKFLFITVAIVLLCIGFSACDKEEENIPATENFNLKTYFSTASSHDFFQTNIIKYVNKKENPDEYVDNLIELYGIPVWSKAYRMDTYYFLPLKD